MALVNALRAAASSRSDQCSLELPRLLHGRWMSSWAQPHGLATSHLPPWSPEQQLLSKLWQLKELTRHGPHLVEPAHNMPAQCYTAQDTMTP